ncbi:MAG TPA: glycosyltransferase, partial [Spirochaetes bacterium]|nr:glycosyltransferase [Spirochaetota bacterium]
MDRPTVKLSVIVPVLNESVGINRLIGYLRETLPAGNTEIIVVDGDPGGSTLKAVIDPLVIKHTAPRGRSFQMNEGARRSRGEILLFLHADTFPPGTFYADIMAAMDNTAVGAGAFRLGFPSRRLTYRLIGFFANIRSRLTRIPFGDQAIFVRRRLFEEIGGYALIPLMEDID